MIPNSTIFTWTVEAAEKVTGVDSENIIGACRSGRVARARSAVFYSLHSMGWPAKRIAHFFHGMDSEKIADSTISHGIKRAKKLRDEDWSFLYLCDQIKNIVDEEKKSVRTVSIGLQYTR